MVLPIIDMIAVQRARAYRLGYHGLVIVVRGHEEIFFELSSRERRDGILDLLESQLEDARAQLKTSQHHSKTRLEADALKELEASVKSAPLPAELVESSPIMFSSTTSSFVTFKPSTSLRSTSNLPLGV
jgi:sterol 3beta-glucosyltransferase